MKIEYIYILFFLFLILVLNNFNYEKGNDIERNKLVNMPINKLRIQPQVISEENYSQWIKNKNVEKMRG